MSSAAAPIPAVTANQRILAKFIDTWVLGFVGSFVVFFLWTIVFGPLSTELTDNRLFGSWMAIISMILLDVPCTKLWGRSPGKAVLGLRVVSTDGSAITWKQAWQRSLLVWVKGLALGLPLVWLVTALVSMRRVTKTGLASWDEASRTRVVSVRAVVPTT
jgi:uncharacterized RDD family membrane protein YckC